jgi:hypothetical protein
MSKQRTPGRKVPKRLTPDNPDPGVLLEDL